MRKGEFLARLRADACGAADRAMAESGRTTHGCPYVDQLIGRFAHRPARQVERVLRMYAPEARGAQTADEYLPLVSARVGRGAAVFARTGQLPGDMPAELTLMAMGDAGGLVGALVGAVSAVGRLFAKSDGAPPAAVDTAALADRLGPGAPLDAGTRGRMEEAFGDSFADLQVHTDARAARLSSDLDAHAFTLGSHIAFSSEAWRPGTPTGDAILAHELAHVIQQRGAAIGEGPAAAHDGAGYERDADVAAAGAVAAVHGGVRRRIRPALASPIRMQRCAKKKLSPELQKALADPTTLWSKQMAVNVMMVYQDQSSEGRDAFVATWAPLGQLGPMVRKLKGDLIATGGTFEPAVVDLLQRVQRHGVLESAKASALADEDAMAAEQAKFMHAKNLAEAQKGKPAGAPPPTQEEVAAQHKKEVEKTSIPTQTGTMTAAQEAKDKAEVAKAIPVFVAWVKANHPQLKITPAHIRNDPRAVFKRGKDVIAFSDSGAVRAVVGVAFANAVNGGHPERALPLMVHELWGHREYGDKEYAFGLYDRSAAKMPGYKQPSGAARTSEYDAFGYQETEMYAEMRELEFTVPSDPNFAASQKEISDRVGIIVKQWEPRVAKALLRGLFQRFRIDPRIVAISLAAFEKGVNAHVTVANGFGPGDAKDILQ